MSDRPEAAGAPPRRRRWPRRVGWGLAALLMSWTVASGDVRAERIVLKSGEVIDGEVVDATRNTVVVRRSIGGMRQMRVQDIAEVRLDLAEGQQVAGQFLSWTDGVYEVGSGDEVIRVSESGILSREPRPQTARLLPTRARGAQQSTAAAAPSSAPAEQRAEPATPAAPAEQDRSGATAEAGSDAAAAADDAERRERETEAQTTAARESQPGATAARAAAARESQAAAAGQSQASETGAQGAAARESQAAVTRQSRAPRTEAQAAPEVEDGAAAERPSQRAAGAQTPPEAEPETQARADAKAAAERQSQAAAGEEHAALGDHGILAVKASVDRPEPGDRSMLFKIELSQPAEQPVVLIYGTVDGTAKAGEDYEAQQGMVTLAPGDRSAEVRVPLLKEGQPEDREKRFELVLMADPKVAEVLDRRVIATIKGAD